MSDAFFFFLGHKQEKVEVQHQQGVAVACFMRDRMFPIQRTRQTERACMCVCINNQHLTSSAQERVDTHNAHSSMLFSVNWALFIVFMFMLIIYYFLDQILINLPIMTTILPTNHKVCQFKPNSSHRSFSSKAAG